MKKKSTLWKVLAVIAIVIAIVGLVVWNNVGSMLAMSGMMGGSDIVYDNPEHYEIVSVYEQEFNPTSIEPSDDPNAYTLVVEPVQNADTAMMKRAIVTAGDGTSWQLMSDEGGNADYLQQAPNPLSYMIAGSSMNLVNQLTATAIDMGLNVGNVQVEQRITFRQPDLMTDQSVGYTDEVTTSILIDSDEPIDDLERLTDTALAAWVAGEGYSGESAITTNLYINGEHYAEHYSTPGIIVAGESTIDQSLVMQRQSDNPAPTTIEAAEDAGMSIWSMLFGGGTDLDFEMIAVAESVGTAENPYLSKARVRCNMAGYRSWDIYADDAELYGGTSTLPTSLHYFTAGTGLCLTTQMTGAVMALDLDLANYRAEQQIVYSESTTETVITNIVVKSDESQEDLEQFASLSLQMCFAGEALQNATSMEDMLYVNGVLR